MADHYSKLTEAEKCYWDVYTRLRELSDWQGFSPSQKQVQDESRAWLVNQRKSIWRAAQPKSKGGDGKGWKHANRSARYEQLRDEKLNTGTCRRVASLPSNGGTPGEKAGIAERRMWWMVNSVDDRTKKWRQGNADWATTTRRQIYSLAEQKGQGGWNKSDRQLRYDNLCIATKTGDAYKSWAKTHNTVNGKLKPKAPAKSKGRSACLTNMRRYVGVSENPMGSNRGSPQPNGWQNRVIGGTGFAWCACFASCMAWDAGVKGAGSAGVASLYDMARRSAGIYRGVTTDPSRVRTGDHAVVGSISTHVGVVASDSDACHLIEGNASNGVREQTRNRGSIVCWLLVDFD